MTLDVVVFGETMVQLSPDLTPLASTEQLNVRVAGAETNVACWLASAGRDVAWLGAVGADPLGERVLASVSAYGVDTSLVVQDSDAPTALFIKHSPTSEGSEVLYYRNGSAAATISQRMAHRLPRSTIFHVSGITLGLSHSSEILVRRMVRRAQSRGAVVSFDVNFRPKLWRSVSARRAIAHIASRLALVFVGRDEAEALWGTAEPSKLTSLFPHARIIVKDAAVGASSFGTDRLTTFVATPPVDVIEVVGAGDAFAAGYLDAVLDGVPEVDRLLRGHQYAAKALTTYGDLPTWAELSPPPCTEAP